MAPTYKLTYFNATALGDPIRLLFSYGNIEFEDVRVSFEEWPALKPKTPLGELPILEHNGNVMNQSVAIYRYLGKKTKLNGSDDWEDLEIDAAMDTISDFLEKTIDYHYDEDPQSKEAKKESLFNEILPFYIEKLETMTKKNNGYFAVGKLTWVDIAFVGLLRYLNGMLGRDLTENAPNLKSLKEKVVDIPQIKNYLAIREKPKFY